MNMEDRAGRGTDRDASADEDSSGSTVDPNNGGSSNSSSNGNNNTTSHLQQELPFLVTHWLANYGRHGSNNDDSRNNNLDESNTIIPTSNSSRAGDDTSTNNSLQQQQQQQREREEALSTIRRATSELASAFSILGAYGSTMQVRWWGKRERESLLFVADAFYRN